MMVKAVLFDLYGTLVRLQRDRVPYMQLYRKVGFKNLLRESMTVESPTLIELCSLLDVKPTDDIADLQSDLEADIQSAVTFTNALSTLNKLKEKHLRIAVISNLATPYKSVYYNLGLDQLVDFSVFSCEIGVTKPDPRIYEAALSLLEVDGKDTIMIGDSMQSDVIGPSACGIKGILIDRSKNNSNENVISTLKDVEKYLI